MLTSLEKEERMSPLHFTPPLAGKGCSCDQVVAVVSLPFIPFFWYVFLRSNFKLSSLTKLEKLSPALALCLVCSELLQALMSQSVICTICLLSADQMSRP